MHWRVSPAKYIVYGASIIVWKGAMAVLIEKYVFILTCLRSVCIRMGVFISDPFYGPWITWATFAEIKRHPLLHSFYLHFSFFI